MRPAYLMALALALALGFWMTGRADPALARWSLNRGDCVQAFTESYFCGAREVKHIEYITGPGERRHIPGIVN